MAVVIAVLILLLAGCGPPPASGLTREEVCERFFTALRDAGGSHVEQATAALAFAQAAGPVAEPGLAVQVADIETQAQLVLDELPPNAAVAEPLYRATTALYVECVRDVYRAVLEGDVELTGACAEPGAPTLEGPNVVVYGSAGHDFVSSTCELVEGGRVGDGCSYSGSETASADLDGHVFASVEVAYDPDTCRALFESGPVHPDDLP